MWKVSILYMLLICGALIICRLLYLLMCIHNNKSKKLLSERNRKKTWKTIIIIGSGGHTAEMIRVVKHLNPAHFTPRIYIMADSDFSSLAKVMQLEETVHRDSQYSILKIPRSRSVKQSYLTSVFTTLYSILYCVPVVFLNCPHLIICNGPGTCVPVCVVSFLSRLLLFCDNITIFIESICRVKTLSLTGKILLFIADKIIVQWPELRSYYGVTLIDEL